jgi:hypothetical protein
MGKFIAGVRESVLTYVKTLPDFACSRVSRLEVLPYVPPAPPAKGKAAQAAPKTTPPPAAEAPAAEVAEVGEDRLTWLNHKDEVSAPPGAPKKPIVNTSGVTDFVGLLTDVFSETAHAEFKWKGPAVMRGVPVLVFNYKVAKENSAQEVQAGAAHITVGYQGYAVTDRRTGRILSIGFEAEIPPDFPVQDVKRLFDFGQSLIGGQFVLMPLQSRVQERGSVDLLRDGKTGGKSAAVIIQTTTDFQSCHRYVAPPPKPLP